MEILQELMKNMGENMMPLPESFHGMYCTVGTAMCSDLDFEKMCNCASCPVWQENELGSKNPGGYYCKNGRLE